MKWVQSKAEQLSCML